jgi:hypothetical protein
MLALLLAGALVALVYIGDRLLIGRGEHNNVGRAVEGNREDA